MRFAFRDVAKRICIVHAVSLFNAYVISTRHESTNLIKIIASASLVHLHSQHSNH